MTNKKVSATARNNGNCKDKADSSAALRNDKQKRHVQRQEQRQLQRQTADSSAALRNDKQKGKCNGKKQLQLQRQSRFLRCAAE